MDMNMIASMLGFDPAMIETFKQQAIAGIQDFDARLKRVEKDLSQILEQQAIANQRGLEIITLLGELKNGPGNAQLGNDSNRNHSGESRDSAG